MFALIALPACSGDRAAHPPGAALAERIAPPASIAAAAPAAPEAAPVPASPEAAPAAAVVAPPVAPATYADAIAQGKAAAAGGDRARARQLFEAAVKLDRRAAEPHIELARLFIADGERGMAIAAAHQAVKRAPDSSPAYNTLGRAELARFNYDAAVAAFVRA
ncbi:MAG TPA: hypothetical protein VK601_14525, partial [Kofleriaceae bacterium]|nr:hypothetical protein [Kofleriaceae bacterium]